MAARSARESGRSSRRRVSRPEATTSHTEVGTPEAALARCGTKPIRDQASYSANGVPNSRSSPEVSGSRPVMVRTSVVFPEPFAPIRARNSPDTTVRSMPRRTGRPPMATEPPVSWMGGRHGWVHPLASSSAVRFSRIRER